MLLERSSFESLGPSRIPSPPRAVRSVNVRRERSPVAGMIKVPLRSFCASRTVAYVNQVSYRESSCGIEREALHSSWRDAAAAIDLWSEVSWHWVSFERRGDKLW